MRCTKAMSPSELKKNIYFKNVVIKRICVDNGIMVQVLDVLLQPGLLVVQLFLLGFQLSNLGL